MADETSATVLPTATVARGAKADPDAAGDVDLSRPHSLHQIFPRWQGYVTLLLLACNVALQVYSHTEISLVVRSNVNPDLGAGVVSGVANCSATDPAFAGFWAAGGDETVFLDTAACITVVNGYGLARNETKAEECLRNTRGFLGGAACVQCYFDVMLCAVDNCVSPCFSVAGNGILTQTCLDCVNPNCNATFETCSGLDIAPSANSVRRRRLIQYLAGDTHGGARARALRGEPQGERSLQTSSASLADAGQLYDLYAISFVDSVRDTWNADAKLVAVLLTLLSGVWPYAKNVIMFVAWFVPMTLERRSAVLKNLTRLAKWSLVDVFVIVIILAGLGLDEVGPVVPRLVLVAESRSAIYTFCLAAIWDLAQGEWMRTKHLHVAEMRRPAPHPQLGKTLFVDAVPIRRGGDDGAALGCGAVGRWLLATVGFVHLTLAFMGMVLVCVTFETSGDAYGGTLFTAMEGPVLDFSVFTMGGALLEPERLEVSLSVPGTYFLVAVFVLCAAVIPLWMYAGFMTALFIPDVELCCGARNAFRRFCVSLDVVGGFACLDVFLLSLLVTMLEWDRFVTAALSDISDLAPGCADPCLETRTTLGAGVWFMCAAVPVGWALELFFTFAYAEVFEPAEQTYLGPRIFNAVLPAGGCAKPRR